MIQTAYHLETGDPVCAFLAPWRRFEEDCRFGQETTTASNLKDWLRAELEGLADAAAHMTAMMTRPFILPMPEIALGEQNLAEFANLVLQHTRLCPQEISFEFTDAALVIHAANALDSIRAYRRHGFRVSIDARRCWQSNLPIGHWLMIDTLRVDPSALVEEQALEERVEAASAAGVSIIAERPAWRDGALLADFGVSYGLRPLADA